MRKSLTRHERLKKRSDIKAMFSSADSITVKGMRLLYRKNGLPHNRFLVTLIRKYGNAVQRNRAKRILREIYRNSKYELIPGFDIGVILYSGGYDYEARLKQYRSLLMKAGIFK
jgi:ribonuclease P protein component